MNSEISLNYIINTSKYQEYYENRKYLKLLNYSLIFHDIIHSKWR